MLCLYVPSQYYLRPTGADFFFSQRRNERKGPAAVYGTSLMSCAAFAIFAPLRENTSLCLCGLCVRSKESFQPQSLGFLLQQCHEGLALVGHGVVENRLLQGLLELSDLP